MEKRKWAVMTLAVFTVLLVTSEFAGGQDASPAAESAVTVGAPGQPEELEDDDFYFDDEAGLSDPLEPINRIFFEFNDRLYFWVLKPVAKGYKAVVPEPARVSVSSFFKNLAFPIRFVNCLFQGKIEGAGEELGSFLLNSIGGMGGLFDIAGAAGVRRYDEDLDQSLAVFGFGPGFYIHWPVLGPSTLRGSMGKAGDLFLDPLSYLGDYWYAPWSRGLNIVNETSFRIGDYESLKRAALDPYVALRDAYHQNRLMKIEE